MVNTLYAAAAGTVSLDFRANGTIFSVASVGIGAATGNWELSFNSSSSFTTNDTTGVICGGAIAASYNLNQTFTIDESVDVGERIFLHTTGANVLRVFIYLKESGPASSRAAVRRR